MQEKFIIVLCSKILNTLGKKFFKYIIIILMNFIKFKCYNHVFHFEIYTVQILSTVTVSMNVFVIKLKIIFWV